ncbi:MAG: NAD-dependent epimerase/dehydratase family protein, partial [Hyphomicrobium sp.]
GLKHIVGVGTAHEIGPYLGAVHEDLPTNPAHPYGTAKDFLRRAQGFYAQEAGAHSQWLRCFYIVGDDRRNNSIFRKLLDAADRKEDTFPLNDGEILFDFIHVAELARQMARVSSQTAVCGIINCCTGKPETLKSRVTSFIKEQGLAIKPEWGAFPLRAYETRGIWGDRKRLDAANSYHEASPEPAR